MKVLSSMVVYVCAFKWMNEENIWMDDSMVNIHTMNLITCHFKPIEFLRYFFGIHSTSVLLLLVEMKWQKSFIYRVFAIVISLRPSVYCPFRFHWKFSSVSFWLHIQTWLIQCSNDCTYTISFSSSAKNEI